MTTAFQEITFGWVDGAVVQLGIYFALATNTNPSSAAPPYWPRLSDTPEGRRELARRIGVLRNHSGGGHALHGTERWEHISEWVEKEGLLDASV